MYAPMPMFICYIPCHLPALISRLNTTNHGPLGLFFASRHRNVQNTGLHLLKCKFSEIFFYKVYVIRNTDSPESITLEKWDDGTDKNNHEQDDDLSGDNFYFSSSEILCSSMLQ